MPRAEPALPLRHALLLGLLQGPTELLPVSSAAHTTLVPALAGWPYSALEPGLRKSFELALHGGGALALAYMIGRERAIAVRPASAREIAALALATAPPAAAGLLLRRRIEQTLSRPRPIAASLLGGALAMALADRRPQRRRRAQFGPRDGLALGVAQAVALVPGVSRNGATLIAARLRGFRRGDAAVLSWQTGIPVLLGAPLAGLPALLREAPGAGAGPALAAGAGGAFCSTLIAARLLGVHRGRRLAPYALYRSLLALLVIARCAHNRCP